jgi:hypothetical protein
LTVMSDSSWVNRAAAVLETPSTPVDDRNMRAHRPAPEPRVEAQYTQTISSAVIAIGSLYGEVDPNARQACAGTVLRIAMLTRAFNVAIRFLHGYVQCLKSLF